MIFLFRFILLYLLMLGSVVGVTFESWHTESGVEVIYYSDRSLPMIDVQFAFAAGTARDNEKPGVAQLTTALLFHGQVSDSTSITAALEGVGTRYSADVTKDQAWIWMRCLSHSDKADPSLKLLSSVISEFDFSDASLALEKSKLIQAVGRGSRNSRSIAKKEFNNILFKAHPYSQYPTVKDIKAITRSDIMDFYYQYYVANNAVLAMVGDLSIESARALSEHLTQDIPRGVKAPKLIPVKATQHSQTVHLEFDSTQSTVIIGQLAYPQGYKHHTPLMIANELLGGAKFSSVLLNDLREKRGLVYSVSSSLAQYQAGGVFMISLKVKNDNVEKVIEIVNKHLQDLASKEPSQNRFEIIIQGLVGRTPMKSDSHSELLDWATDIAFYDLPLDTLDTEVQKIKAQSKRSVHQQFKALIDPHNLITVIVGGKTKK